MNAFLRLNVKSILYAFIIFIPIELFVNASRISRLTGSNIDEASKVIGVVSIASVALFSALTIYITKRWMKSRITSFWSILLWFPYLILFTCIFAFEVLLKFLHRGYEGQNLRRNQTKCLSQRYKGHHPESIN